ncbi:MAG: GIY-YIG nuclease family protein [Thermotaleaceae bacterium]
MSKVIFLKERRIYLSEKIKEIPTKPGVYQMKDAEGNILYIGKSKRLKSRVRSYFNTEHKWRKIKRMVFHIHDIDFIITDTHLEAQLLECALIKKIKPLYNIQFKNDKKYQYLKIGNGYGSKPLSIVDERENEYCFGPYRNANILFDLVHILKNIYPIFKSGNSYSFTYNIWPMEMDKDDSERNKKSMIEIFSKQECMEAFLWKLEDKMKAAALEFQYERASIYRDISHLLKYIFNYNTKAANPLKIDRVLIGEKIEDGYKLFYISNDRLICKKKYKEITKDLIEEFVLVGKKIEHKRTQIESEKRELDFRKIVRAEIQGGNFKAVLELNEKACVDKFLYKLLE